LNPKTSLSPVTYYQRPGLKFLSNDPANLNPVRGLYRASNGAGYCVIGLTCYAINADWSLTNIGTLLNAGTNPVSFTDNGIEMVLVDGSANGYIITLASNAFTQWVDAGFTGATGVDNIDTFVLWNFPGTQQWGSTLSNQIVPLDPLYIASKSSYPDFLERIIVNRHEILLIGSLKSEIWYDAGNAQFPFSILPGAYIEHGTCAPYSVASSDISVFWLSQDLQGVGYVLRQRGYDTTIISNYALSYAIRKMAKAGTISDAIGYTYTQDGHAFYVLSFPTGNQTWVFDDSLGDPTYGWHQRCWTDAQGGLNRDRTNCHAFINGVNVVGDWQNGALYALDLDTYTDNVGGNNLSPCSYIRTFSTVTAARITARVGQQADAEGKRIQFHQFVADIETGDGPGGPADPVTGVPTPDQVWMRYSDDRGKTFHDTILQSNGKPGEYAAQPMWSALGITRYRVFEIGYSIAGPAALNGAWIEATLEQT